MQALSVALEGELGPDSRGVSITYSSHPRYPARGCCSRHPVPHRRHADGGQDFRGGRGGLNSDAAGRSGGLSTHRDRCGQTGNHRDARSRRQRRVSRLLSRAQDSSRRGTPVQRRGWRARQARGDRQRRLRPPVLRPGRHRPVSARSRRHVVRDRRRRPKREVPGRCRKRPRRWCTTRCRSGRRSFCTWWCGRRGRWNWSTSRSATA